MNFPPSFCAETPFRVVSIEYLLRQQLQKVIGNDSVEIPIQLTNDTSRKLPTPGAPRYLCAIALRLSPQWQRPPMEIAREIVSQYQCQYPESQNDFLIAVVPPGMILFQVRDRALSSWLQILSQTPLSLSQISPSSEISHPSSFPLTYTHARCCSLLRLAHRDRLITLKTPEPEITPPLWEIITPKPIIWLNEQGHLLLNHPTERDLIYQFLATLDTLILSLSPGQTEDFACPNPPSLLRGRRGAIDLAYHLSKSWENFYAQCRIWGEVKRETPKISQARLGLIIITHNFLRFMLQELLHFPVPWEL
jgi:arginyl-tRNA synthetase